MQNAKSKETEEDPQKVKDVLEVSTNRKKKNLCMGWLLFILLVGE